jgi:diguanylate cyclase (GGDEF)-like protein
MERFSFRQKIVLLAATLVVCMQLVTLYPVLNVVRGNSLAAADQAVNVAGVVLDEFMANREQQLLTTATVLVGDFGFKQAVGSGERETIRSALINHSARAGADIAVLVDLDGVPIASSSESDEILLELGPISVSSNPQTANAPSVTYVNQIPYQTVSVMVRAPLPVARVLLGFQIDAEMASFVASLTGLNVTFLNFRDGLPNALASTLPSADRDAALADLKAPRFDVASASPEATADGAYLTLVRPFLSGDPSIFVAMQLSLEGAISSYRSIRLILLSITGISLLLAITGAVWVANMVTRPVDRLAQAARRMQEGVYTELIERTSNDELGDLADGFNSMQKAIAERERHIFHVAHHNSLTGLPNRELMVSLLRDMLDTESTVSVISVAVAKFSRIVASLGHGTSDKVIQHVAGLLREIADEEDVVGHLTGDEFIIVLPGCDDTDALRRIDKLAQHLHTGVQVEGANISLQLSAGVATYPDHGADAAGLLHRASIARSEAQLLKETAAVYRSGQEDRAQRQLRILGDFPRAIENGELQPYFQPKIDCVTRRVYGAEALVRWQHPELGLLTPFEFVDPIEQAGSIGHLTRWMMRASVAECRRWKESGLNLTLAVNISVEDLIDEYLPYYLLELTGEYGVKPDSITLEVTESAIMHNVYQALSVVSCIHELGFRLSIDDFGTGQSSLAQLKRLPVDELKIDRSFVMNMEDPKDEAIVHATIELAQRLHLVVCAEGVEDLAILDKLGRMGAQFAQGFAIAKPLPAAEFLEWHGRWTGGIEHSAARRLSGAVV